MSYTMMSSSLLSMGGSGVHLCLKLRCVISIRSRVFSFLVKDKLLFKSSFSNYINQHSVDIGLVLVATHAIVVPLDIWKVKVPSFDDGFLSCDM